MPSGFRRRFLLRLVCGLLVGSGLVSSGLLVGGGSGLVRGSLFGSGLLLGGLLLGLGLLGGCRIESRSFRFLLLHRGLGLADDFLFASLRVDLDLLLGDVLLDDVELDAAVLLAALFGRVVRDRLGDAVALGGQTLGVDAVVHAVLHHGLGAVVGQRE